MPILETIAGGLGDGLAGGLVNSLFAGQANRQAGRTANTQMNYNTWMAGKAHQLEVEDLKAAGLNPNLSAGGGGASGAPAPSQTTFMPQVSLPEVLPAIMNMTQLKQNQEKIDIERERVGIDKANSAAAIAKSVDDRDLTRAKKVMTQKGLIRAEAEGEAAGFLKQQLKLIKDYWTNPKPPKQQNSSGGSLP